MPSRILIAISILIFCQLKSYSQPVFQWAKTVGDFGASNREGHELPVVTVDAAGNQYIADRFSDIMDVDPGPGTQLFYPTTTTGIDYYLLKLNADGDFVWAKHLNFEVVTLDLDKKGSILLIGRFWGDSVDVDPGPDSTILTRYRLRDAFLCKWDSNGVFKWSYNPKGAEVSATAADPQNRVVVAGSFSDTVDFDPGPAVVNMMNIRDAGFTVKLNENGDYLWSNQNEGIGFGSVAVDDWGNIIETGWMRDSADLDPGPVRLIKYRSDPPQNILVNRLDSSGDYSWTHVITGSDYYVYFRDMTVDKAGNVIVAGLYTDTLYSDDGIGLRKLFVSKLTNDDLQSFVVKLKADGKIAWADDLSTAGSHLTAFENFMVPMEVATDTAGNIFVASAFRDSADVDPGPGIFQLKVRGSALLYFREMDMSLTCLHPDGSLAWAKSFGADTGQTYATGIGIDKVGNIFISGCFGDSVDVDPGVNTYPLTSSNYYWNPSGTVGTFMLKLGQCSNPRSYFSTQTCDSFLFNGYMRRQSGTYYQRFSNGDCDSIAVLDLIIDTANANVMQVAQTLYAQSPTGVYQWINCDSGMSAIQGANDWKFMPTVSGRYALMVTDNRCVAVSPCYNLIGTGIGVGTPGQEIICYPNPTKGEVVIDFGAVKKSIQVDVFDYVGRVVGTATAMNKQMLTITIPGPDGLYFLSLKDETGNKHVVKLIKNK